MSPRLPELPVCCTWWSRAGSSAWSRRAGSRRNRFSTYVPSLKRGASRASSGSRSPLTTRRAGSSSSNYTDRNGDTRVVRYRSNGTKALPASAKQLLFVDQPYSNHNGGMVAYGPDGLVYVGMGDGGSGGDPENRAQNPASRLGKILRLDPASPTAKPVIVALGVRNPWRFSFDRANGDLWVGDVGQGSIEEVDHFAWPWQGLLNFGWDVYEGTASFESKALGPGRLVAPVAQYTHEHGCSITGGYIYRGSAVPAAKGRYFYGDYCSGTVWSLKLVGEVAQVRAEPFKVPSLTSFGEDAAGELYAVSGNGALYRLRS